MLDLVMMDGTKSVPLEALPESAWRYVTGGSSGDGELAPATAVQVVPILYRALNMRANAIASMPWALTRGKAGGQDVTESDEYRGITRRMGRRLRLTSQSLDVYGRAYWVKEANQFGRNLTPRWLMPTSLTEVTEATATERIRAETRPLEGLYGFTRRAGEREMFLPWDQVVWFWEPSQTSEVGYGPGCVRAALAAAGALNHMDRFVEAYFKRGVIKATVFQVEGNASKGEMEAVQTVLRSMLSGIKKAFSLLVLRNNFKPIVIGDSAKDTAAPELTTQKREDIAMAMGVPFSLLYSQAANYATSQTDYMTFYTQTVLPQAEMMQETLNELLFDPLGLWFEFQPRKLEVFQASELQKADAIMKAVGKPVLLVDEGRELLDRDPLPAEKIPPRLEGMLVADVETGVVTKNERRQRLGLEEAPEDVTETSRRQLLAQLQIVQAATNAKLTPAEGVRLALGEPLESLLTEDEGPQTADGGRRTEDGQQTTDHGLPTAEEGQPVEDGEPQGGDQQATDGRQQADGSQVEMMKALLAEVKAARAQIALRAPEDPTSGRTGGGRRTDEPATEAA